MPIIIIWKRCCEANELMVLINGPVRSSRVDLYRSSHLTRFTQAQNNRGPASAGPLFHIMKRCLILWYYHSVNHMNQAIAPNKIGSRYIGSVNHYFAVAY
jgi:hypothetical protein